MWTPIFEQNKENILKGLSEYIDNLEAFKQMIAGGDYQGLFETMENTNRIKEILAGIPASKVE